MSKAYVGVNNTARLVTNIYAGVDGTARKVIHAYAGVNGLARMIFESVKETAVSIPVMTSNTTPSGTASASSEYNTNSRAWKAMDGNETTQWTSASGTKSTGGTGWIQYDFGYPVRPTVMTYKPVNSSSYRAKNYSLLGSNDGSEFTELAAGVLPNSSDTTTVTLNVSRRYSIFRLVLTDKYAAANRFFVAVFGIDGFAVES